MTLSEILNLLKKEQNKKLRQMAANARCALNKASQRAEEDFLLLEAADFSNSRLRIEDAIMSLPSPMKSRTAWRSAVRSLYGFALQNGYVSISGADLAMNGYPIPTRAECGTRRTKVEHVLMELIKRVMPYVNSYHDLKSQDVQAFADSFTPACDQHDGWRAFTKWWNEQADQRERPDLHIHRLSRQPSAYKIALDDLPPHLQKDIEKIRGFLDAPRTRGAHKGQALRESTRELVINGILRLLGWLKTNGIDLTTAAGLEDLFSVDHIVSYLTDRNAAAQQKYGTRDDGFGKTQESFLISMESVIRHGLGNASLADSLGDVRKHYRGHFYKRREASKTPGYLEDYFKMAHHLLERFNDVQSEMSLTGKGVLVRDAVLLIILGSMGYRRQILTYFEVGDNFYRTQNKIGQSVWRIRISAAQTKPNRRDLLHDLPACFTSVIDFYVDHVRKKLVRGKHNSLFFNHHGKPLAADLVYRAVTDRCQEILDTHHNPHQVRKAWTNEWLEYSDGDYITASAILDSSPSTLEKSYEQRSSRKAGERLDERMTGGNQ